MQKTKEEDFLKLFDKWKEEEKEKLVDEMEKVKEMFMKEFKELTSKNSALEYVSIKPRRSHDVSCLERWCWDGIMARGSTLLVLGQTPPLQSPEELKAPRKQSKSQKSFC